METGMYKLERWLYVISLENGKYNPSIILAFKIANIFGRSIEEIFIYEEE